MTPGPALPENRFTNPTPLCPYPERWTSTDDHSTEVEVSEFLGGLVRCLQPDLCFETGSAWGQTAEQIGLALDANDRGWLVTCEPDPERAQFTRERCARWHRVDVFEGPSLDWTPPGPVQFAFFDSLFDLRVPEFLHLRPFMPIGAVVAFHDTAPRHGEKVAGGLDLRGEIEQGTAGLLRLIHFPTPRGITIGEVL